MESMPPRHQLWSPHHLTMRWGYSDEAYKILSTGEIYSLGLEAGDWSDLDWLTDFRGCLKSIRIGSEVMDWRSIGRLSELQDLKIEGDFKIKFDFSVLQNLKSLQMYFRRDYGSSIFQLSGLEYLKINGWKGDDVTAFSKLRKLKYINLIDSKLLKSLKGFEGLGALEGLDIAVANNLTDIGAIGKLGQLKYLKLANCKRITAYDCLKFNTELLSLIIAKTSDIESLSILDGMKKLDYLSFGSGTKVVDGDLAVLYKLKSLRQCRYTNAQHYNIKKKDFDAHQFEKYGERSVECEDIWLPPKFRVSLLT
ncbi:hypothetical protein [Leucothrix arctica]|uniref:Leucine-rich repeat domain-containing protein n=1 Tax=Leucothrix arctica TaxID=1481894 RepID=A0A317C8Y4_9GAMM|nr:hypothetical protein [Leucothrix arctica]PWQ95054.1 hypothetical protein DKT75_13620 [Leucothrix arctica]